MPRKPKKPCSYPGCPKLTDGRYCQEHQSLVHKQYNRYSRNAAHRKRYGAAWKKVRDAYAAAHQLCEVCLREGRYVKMEEVHHVKPLSEGGTHEMSNLIALCKSCHSRIHSTREDRWKRKPREYESTELS